MILRNYISIGVLLAFVVLLTPRDWWHDCDHHQVEHNSGTVQIDQDDCSVCDYHISVWAKPTNLLGITDYTVLKQPKTELPVEASLPFVHYFLLRGPPVS